MLSFYKTLVRPHVEYCLSAWSPLCEKGKRVDRKDLAQMINMEGNLYDDGLR